MMDKGLIALAAAAIIIALILFLIIHFSPKSNTLDREKYQSRWLSIESKSKSGSVDAKHMAILQADKLLDLALKETGSRGQTMAERMKSRQGVWSNANAVWAAHKLRNRIAHDDNVNVSDDTARRALASFKRALKDLGAM